MYQKYLKTKYGVKLVSQKSRFINHFKFGEKNIFHPVALFWSEIVHKLPFEVVC